MTRATGAGQFIAEIILALLESRFPVAVALPLLAFVIGNEGEERRAAVAALCLAF